MRNRNPQIETNMDREHEQSDHWLQMTQSMGRLEGKMDQVLAAQLDQREKHKDHEDRIRSLEKHKGRVIGIAAGAGAVVSGVAWFVSQLSKSGVLPT